MSKANRDRRANERQRKRAAKDLPTFISNYYTHKRVMQILGPEGLPEDAFDLRITGIPEGVFGPTYQNNGISREGYK